MQPGFAWLDKRTLEVDYERHELSAPQALELFIDVLDADANSYAAFRQLKTYNEQLEKRKAAAAAHGRGEPASSWSYARAGLRVGRSESHFPRCSRNLSLTCLYPLSCAEFFCWTESQLVLCVYKASRCGLVLLPLFVFGLFL